MNRKIFIVLSAIILAGLGVKAQNVVKELKADVNRSAGTYYSLPAIKTEHDTPAPAGMKPFYINHMHAPHRTISKRENTTMIRWLYL